MKRNKASSLSAEDEQAKLKEVAAALEHALSFERMIEQDEFYAGGIAKAFEVALEYAWKYLKHRVNSEHLEAYSPREAIKLAGSIMLIDDPEFWLRCLDARNLAVHDYIGISRKDYLRLIKRFLEELKRLIAASGGKPPKKTRKTSA